MSPPTDRRSRPDAEDDPTGIHSIATKALLEALREDVRDMRSELAGNTGITIRVEDRQKDLAAHVLESDKRLAAIEADFRQHQGEEAIWQLRQQAELEKVSTQLSLVAPLTATHEQILQQAKGAAWATKVLYAIAGAIGVGGIQALIHIFAGKN